MVATDNRTEAGPYPKSHGAMRHPTRASSVLLLGFDLAVFATSFVVFGWSLIRGVPFTVTVLGILMMRGHYRTRMARDVSEDVSIIVGAIASAILVVAIGVTIFGIEEPEFATVVSLSFGLLLLLMASRTIAFKVLRRLRTKGWFRSSALVVGTDLVAREIAIEFSHRRDYGVDVIGFVARDELRSDVLLPGPILGNLSDLADLSRLTGSDRLIVTMSNNDGGDVVSALRSLPTPGTSIFVMPHLFELGVGVDTMTPERARGYALVRLGRSAHPVIGVRCKRLFDLVSSVVAIVLLSPLLIGAAIAVKLSSPGPVLFKQDRIGRYAAPFELLKFRSMRSNDDSAHAWTPSASSADITTVGRFLRWSSIDELPQLINIMRGDMSVVGPRPERPVFVDEFTKSLPGYRHRHRLPVGLTGLAQVRGLRGGDTPMEERVKFDNLYIDQWSFFGDLRIVFRTIWSIVQQTSYAEAEIDMARMLAEAESTDQLVIDLVAEEHRLELARARDSGTTRRLGDAGPKLKIVHVTETLVSGVLEVVSSLAQIHTADGHDVTVIGSELRTNTPDDWRTKFDHCNRVEVMRLRHNPGPWDLVSVSKLRRLLRDIRPDVVHLHASKAGAIGRVAALGLGIKVLYQPHGAIALANGARATVFRALESGLSRLPGQLVACSESERKVLVATSRQSNVATVPNGIPLHTPRSVDRMRSDPYRSVVVTCGRICDQKNPELFAQIARIVGDEADFLWVGDGDENMTTVLMEAGVKVTGWASHDRALESMRASDVYLQTSRYEGMPISVLEAMALELPVVATDISGNHDVVTHGVTGFLGITSQALVSSLRDVLGDAKLASRMGQRGRTRVEYKFSACSMAESFLGLYDSDPSTSPVVSPVNVVERAAV